MKRQYTIDALSGSVYNEARAIVGRLHPHPSMLHRLEMETEASPFKPDTEASLLAELYLLRDACDVGAVLSRRIKDSSGRVRHIEEIVGDMIKLIEGENG